MELPKMILTVVLIHLQVDDFDRILSVPPW